MLYHVFTVPTRTNKSPKTRLYSTGSFKSQLSDFHKTEHSVRRTFMFQLNYTSVKQLLRSPENMTKARIAVVQAQGDRF